MEMAVTVLRIGRTTAHLTYMLRHLTAQGLIIQTLISGS
jgi:hypothetical protein